MRRIKQLRVHLHPRMPDDRARTKAKLWSLQRGYIRKQIENFTLICRNDHAPTTDGHLPQENTATFSDYSIDLTPRRFALLADTLYVCSY